MNSEAANDRATQPTDWEHRVTLAIQKIQREREVFAAQWQHYMEHRRLPAELEAVATDQLLDALGAIAVTLQQLLGQAEASMKKKGFVSKRSLLGKALATELPPLVATVDTFNRWGLVVPPSLLLPSIEETRTLPLAATDPAYRGGPTVQRILGAHIVAGAPAAVTALAWVDFGADGSPIFEQGARASQIKITRPLEMAPEAKPIAEVCKTTMPLILRALVAASLPVFHLQRHVP